jgi:anti-sigma-K factor RskA
MNADVHALAGAYALNALPPEEAAAFAEHLAHCTPCRLEVAEMQATAAQLGVAAAEEPPEALRERVMNVVRHTRQAPPLTHDRAAEHTGQGAIAEATGHRRRLSATLLSAAAAVVLVLGLGVLLLGPVLDHTGGTDADNHVMAVMHAPDARTSTTDVRGGGSITVISSRKMAAAVVMGERLPMLDAEHDYQLWLIGRTGTTRSTGMLIDASSHRPTGPMMVEGVRPGDHIALTMEHAGGSARPTMPLLAMTERT